MPRYSVGRADRGSQKWLQVLINQRPELISRELAAIAPEINVHQLEWLSPIGQDNFAEYRDRAFLDRLGAELKEVPLSDFWPKGGPVWDGLGVAGNRYFLVEAKAHIPELNSTPMQASPGSAKKINERLLEVKEYLGSGAPVDWTGCFYQHANRLAHLYLFRVLNGLQTWLVNIYFVGDDEMDGPGSRDEWKGAIKLMNSHLGLGRHKLRHHDLSLFFDVKEL